MILSGRRLGLQEMLGHAQLSTTEIYTHVSIEHLQAIHAATHPERLSRSSSAAAVQSGAEHAAFLDALAEDDT